jgi:Domain of unknown function (DUF4145)
MMKLDPRIQARFHELEEAVSKVKVVKSHDWMDYVESETWQKWSTNVLNLLNTAFSSNSVHSQNFKKIYDAFKAHPSNFEAARGVFLAAKEDYEGGYVFSLERAISGEIFGDFVALAKQSLSEGYKDAAAVLACAALEDALKRYARTQEGLNVDDAVMQKVVAALKSKGLVSGAQKTLLDTMPKIRDYAMHANWDKIKAEDVSSVIGFVEQFLISHF